MPNKPFQRPAPLDIHEDRTSTEQQDFASSQGPPDAATLAAASAFEKDWAAHRQRIENSPILAFLRAHEVALTPDEHTICGYSGIKITLGDLKELVQYAG